MRVLLIGNLSDTRCGFANFTNQMVTAMRRTPGAEIETFDGTYQTVYARQQQPDCAHMGMFPEDVGTFDVVHLIWNALTMNHYAGAPWDVLHQNHVIASWWDGGPSDASCPFIDHMDVRWSNYPRHGYYYMPYPVPDWVDNLPETSTEFTVGASSVRGDGVPEIRQWCEKHGWAMNLPTPGNWLTVEDEVRRLARSSVNVCWYNTPPLWHDRASAPSMLLASRRPILINEDPLVAHLRDYPDEQGVYHGRRHEPGPHMEECLIGLHMLWRAGGLFLPDKPIADLSWTNCAAEFLRVWSLFPRPE